MKKAIVLLSGGIDSSVCLAIAKSQGYSCYALSIDYQQRNRHELECAKNIARQIGAVEHKIIHCEINNWGGSALTDVNLPVDEYSKKRGNTYVPARNTVFLSLALSWGEAIGAHDFFFAANAEDYDNYPDCRSEFFTAFKKIAEWGTRAGVEGAGFVIHTPLIQLNKTEIIQWGKKLNVDLSMTFSCYNPIDGDQPCQQCLACYLRQKSFEMLV